jgi:hypothetical protein
MAAVEVSVVSTFVGKFLLRTIRILEQVTYSYGLLL